ncbi:MAG TPA: LssY C-terminal domain-containing protein [Candidatus Tectomicrobia bacterium]|nr:LssY C-terminal domain-containing protein [Candidatus Tectomicrobia bacterium]
MWKRTALVAGGLIVGWLVIAYAVLPMLWTRYTRHHPALADIPNITHTADGIPGDPLNVGLIGTESDLKKIMLAARLYPANPLTLRSRLEIASAAVFEHPYDDAPVSNLYLWGRKEDLAFEQPIGHDPRQRHHVRFWRADKLDLDGRPVWVGAATFDARVGLSHTTEQIMHHTAADIDAERAKLFSDLKQTGDLSEVLVVDDFHQVRRGRNGGGDPWFTDGRLEVGVIRAQ